MNRPLPRTRWLRRLAAVTAVASTLLMGSAVPVLAAPSTWATSQGCPAVFVVGARGSGESRAPEGLDADHGFGTRASGILGAVADLFALHGIRWAPVSLDYPAVGVDDVARGLLDPRSATYGSSVSAGVAALTDLVAATREACPGSLLVLIGYSQGAEVIRRALAGGGITEGPDIAASILIADPRFDAGDAARGVALRGSFQENRRGIRASQFSTPIPDWAAARTFSLCNGGDIVCQFGQGRLPAALLGWRSARDVHEAYGRGDLEPIVRYDLWPLLLARLDPEDRLPLVPR
jgi:hypothetical protein